MPRAVIYLRVSSDEQVESGAGLAAQLDACQAFAARMGWEIVFVFEEEEGLKGDTPLDRCPKLGEAVQALERGDVLLVQKRDRIARDRLKIAMLEAVLRTRKCRLVSAYGEGTEVDDPHDPMAFLMRGMVDVFAEFEKLLIRFRTRNALRAKRRRLERTGKIPYGLELHDDGRRSKPKVRTKRDGTRVVYGDAPIALRESQEEQKILEIMKGYRVGGLSYRAVAERLNLAGYTTKAGKPWCHSTVHHLLNREPYGTPEGPRPAENAG